MSLEKADRLVEILALADPARVVDVGCGTGEFLIRVVKRYGSHGVGIDPDSDALAQCRSRAEGRISLDRLDLRQQSVDAFNWPEHPFCIGSTHAFGGFADTLQALKSRVASGGLILIGDLFWWKRLRLPTGK